ncbi:MAG: chorismate synthase [Suipraeoptans sp.]
MSGSIFGNNFKISTWGESHGKAIGVVIDGCPAGLELCESDIQIFLNRRKPGQSKYTTKRSESDTIEILSGVFEGVTTGTPISLIVFNKDQFSKDYDDIKDVYRPSHADFTFDAKYGFRDYRGGGRSSGRETIGRVAAGAIASKLLKELGIKVIAYTKSIGSIEIESTEYDLEEINNNPLYMPNAEKADKAELFLKKCMETKNSTGGIIECQITNAPAGIGDPVFDKLDADLSKAIMSIGAIKSIEFGDGAKVSTMLGSQNNDSFIASDNSIKKMTNHSGGILGGISDGSTIIFRASVKPTPSIAIPQNTVNRNLENIEIEIKGRHDPIIVPRAVVVVESMAAVTLFDALINNMSSKLDNIKKLYI